MKTNRKLQAPRTHEGAIASHINPEQQLRRSLMACMLWEDTFYEDGVSIAERIDSLCSMVDADKVARMMIEARNDMKLRHAPLWVACALAKRHALKASDLASICNRPDDMTEFLSLYLLGRKGRAAKLAKQVKLGLAQAIKKFDSYQLAKYNRADAIKLRNVLCLAHPKPDNDEQSKVWKKILDNTLESPDTWESALVSGKNKKETFERLLKENKLGALALLRNLRNFKESGVDESLVKMGLANMNTKWVLPFRFIVAAKYAPQWESEIEQTMLNCLSQQRKLQGKTVLIVDVSGSMYGHNISNYSELDRAQVGSSLAILVREMCEQPVIYATAGNDYTRIHKTELVPNRRGFSLSDAVYKMCGPLGGGGIFLKQVLEYVKNCEKEADRIIVITDEQDCDVNGSPEKADAFGKHNYIINVSNEKNGIAYGKFTHISGFSEVVLNYIFESERSLQ